jgi:translation initiation factor eIF-2B subunit delta
VLRCRRQAGWQTQSNLYLLNPTYDAMPAEFVTMIITEVGMVPPSSVPVILREYMRENKMNMGM